MDVGRVLPTRQPYIICKLAPGEGREEEGNCRERVWGKFPPPPVIVTPGSADSHKTMRALFFLALIPNGHHGQARQRWPARGSGRKNRMCRVWDGVY